MADHPCGTYVFELKVDKPPKLAMSQIQRRKYTAPYRAAGKPVWAVGLSFDGKTRQFNGGGPKRLWDSWREARLRLPSWIAPENAFGTSIDATQN